MVMETRVRLAALRVCEECRRADGRGGASTGVVVGTRRARAADWAGREREQRLVLWSRRAAGEKDSLSGVEGRRPFLQALPVQATGDPTPECAVD